MSEWECFPASIPTLFLFISRNQLNFNKLKSNVKIQVRLGSRKWFFFFNLPHICHLKQACSIQEHNRYRDYLVKLLERRQYLENAPVRLFIHPTLCYAVRNKVIWQSNLSLKCFKKHCPPPSTDVNETLAAIKRWIFNLYEQKFVCPVLCTPQCTL